MAWLSQMSGIQSVCSDKPVSVAQLSLACVKETVDTTMSVAQLSQPSEDQSLYKCTVMERCSNPRNSGCTIDVCNMCGMCECKCLAKPRGVVRPDLK